jgi:hypothetical protein
MPIKEHGMSQMQIDIADDPAKDGCGAAALLFYRAQAIPV